MLLILSTISFSYMYREAQMKEVQPGTYEGIYEVVEVDEQYLVLKKDTKYRVYRDSIEVKPGDIIQATVKVSSFSKASYLGDFDSRSYYRSKGITNKGKILEYEKVDVKWSVARAKAFAIEYYEKRLGEKSLAYIKALFFGINDLDSEMKEVYSSLYITHLLAISGLHIQFFYRILLLFFQKCFKIRGEGLALGSIGIYVLFIGYPVACLRAFLFLLFKHWNQKGKIQYTEFDILSITYIGMVFFFPLKAFQVGFILSFLISFILIFMKDFQNSKIRWKRAIFSSYLCIFSILPFLINQTHSLSIAGILLSFVLGYVLGKIVLPLILGMLLAPASFYESIFFLVDDILQKASAYTFPIRIPHLNLFWIAIYYILFAYTLFGYAKKSNKYPFFYFIFYFCVILSLRFTNIFYKVTFIDVGQGDSILIELPFDKGNILVDSYNNLDYLKCIGIRRLDYVILTHFDKDHMDTASEVITQFHVKELIYSKYEDAQKIGTIQVKKRGVGQGDSIFLAGHEFHILGPIKAYEDSNSNSVVLFFHLNQYRFLFTGDMTSKEEQDIIKQYGEKLKCDVLKVGHHGSSTSSSEEFINQCMPKYSIISVGENNVYHLPDYEIINRLEKKSKIYMTKDSGNIEIRIRDSMKISTYR